MILYRYPWGRQSENIVVRKIWRPFLFPYFSFTINIKYLQAFLLMMSIVGAGTITSLLCDKGHSYYLPENFRNHHTREPYRTGIPGMLSEAGGAHGP